MEMGRVAIKQYLTKPEGGRGGRDGGLCTIEFVVGASSAHSSALVAACVPVFRPVVYVLAEFGPVGKSRRGAAFVRAFSPHHCRTITPMQRLQERPAMGELTLAQSGLQSPLSWELDGQCERSGLGARKLNLQIMSDYLYRYNPAGSPDARPYIARVHLVARGGVSTKSQNPLEACCVAKLPTVTVSVISTTRRYTFLQIQCTGTPPHRSLVR
jgi:hypothetical protein